MFDTFCCANTKGMGSIDDLLHSLLIRPESKRGGKCGRQKGKGRRDRKENRRSLREDRGVAGRVRREKPEACFFAFPPGPKQECWADKGFSHQHLTI